MSKKIDIGYIHKEFDKEGYILVSDMYKGNRYKLDYICPEGHKHSTSWFNWNTNKSRCPYCNGGTRVKSYIDIKKEFEKEGCTLVTNNYINSKQRLEYICAKGHKQVTTYYRWSKSKVRCKACKDTKRRQLLYKKLKIGFERENYKLISNEYKSAEGSIEFICPNGHRSNITSHSWNEGHRCKVCAGVGKKDYSDIINFIENNGYLVLSDSYINCTSKLILKCPKGHIYKVSWDHFYNSGYRCPVCVDIVHSIKVSGSGNPNWKGGISKEPYCQDWTKGLKDYVKERDGYKCMNPYCFKKKGNAARLSVHHINYNKKACGPENLITVCLSCNVMANTDRDWHQEWYQTILNKKYGYIYNVNSEG